MPNEIEAWVQSCPAAPVRPRLTPRLLPSLMPSLLPRLLPSLAAVPLPIKISKTTPCKVAHRRCRRAPATF